MSTHKLGFFCTLSLIIRIFPIIFNVLHHFYDEQCSAESWSSLLMSLLASLMDSRGISRILQRTHDRLVFKDDKLAEWSVMPTDALIQKSLHS